MKATVVIGAQYGDEGKGLMTDYFCSKSEKPIVVRFNGGAQAGHTVVTPDKRRHVFSHFGSGTFLGAPTFLSNYFLINPFIWYKEINELKALGLNPVFSADSNCNITTPYDMILNQAAEACKDVLTINGRREPDRAARHGSCGMGINETVTRSENYPIKLVYPISYVKERCIKIVKEYVPARVAELKIILNARQKAIIESPTTLEAFLHYLSLFKDSIRTRNGMPYSSIIFEGAQGLLLDEVNGEFPHVTRSRTGLFNVFHLAQQLGVDELDVCYVTRSYVTRHGNGPLPGEVLGLSFPDDTNIPNEWQGRLRFAPFDLNRYLNAVTNDVYDRFNNQNQHYVKINEKFAMTHLDQFVPNLDPNFKFDYMSYGPTREDVKQRT